MRELRPDLSRGAEPFGEPPRSLPEQIRRGQRQRHARLGRLSLFGRSGGPGERASLNWTPLGEAGSAAVATASLCTRIAHKITLQRAPQLRLAALGLPASRFWGRPAFGSQEEEKVGGRRVLQESWRGGQRAACAGPTAKLADGPNLILHLSSWPSSSAGPSCSRLVSLHKQPHSMFH